MPNWCSNYLTVITSNKEVVAKIKRALETEEEGLFQQFIPMPPDLKDTVAGTVSGDMKEIQAAKEQYNLLKYGYINWYDWANSEWGTKWDVYARDISPAHFTEDGATTTITLGFNTAWGPPMEFLSHLADLPETELTAYYVEEGNGFCGRYDAGGDTYLEYTVKMLKDGTNDLLNEIVDLFGIDYEDYEDEEEEEDSTAPTS